MAGPILPVMTGIFYLELKGPPLGKHSLKLAFKGLTVLVKVILTEAFQTPAQSATPGHSS